MSSATNKHLQLLRNSGFTDCYEAKTAMETKLSTNTLMEGEVFIGMAEDGESVLGIASTSGGSTYYSASMTDQEINNMKNYILGDLILV